MKFILEKVVNGWTLGVINSGESLLKSAYETQVYVFKDLLDVYNFINILEKKRSRKGEKHV